LPESVLEGSGVTFSCSGTEAQAYDKTNGSSAYKTFLGYKIYGQKKGYLGNNTVLVTAQTFIIG
jgi:hypothetical protein